MSLLPRVLAWPVVVIGAACVTRAGLVGGAPPELWSLAVAVAGALTVVALERILPYRRSWNRPRGDVGTDLLHLLLSVGVAGEIGRRLALASPVLAPAWPETWPWGARLVLALVLAELGSYALHRVEHRGGWLGRIHAVHHSAPRLHALNVVRNHPVDALLTSLATIGLPCALGADADTLTTLLVVSSVHAAFQHGNVDLALGPLNLLVSGPEVHRWHHHRQRAIADANYGQVLLIWDLLLGTRVVPAGEPPEDVGIEGDPVPAGWLAQVRWPFSARGGERPGSRPPPPPGR
ncbi:MAG: sterol desaturase family protein [Alphaproteobacteria bacterium]|nr:sterol desaturase family protein [Alphaproteobacteria bacterium]